MLAIVGLITILLVLYLILSKRMTTMMALIVVPMIACVVVGEGAQLTSFITSGINSVAATGTMFIFAVLFFGLMSDTGTFERVVNKIISLIGTNPIKVCVGTFVITLLTHLDGSGATTFLITVPAMLPIYQKLKMKPQVLATIVAMGAGTMNLVPWGGPTIRAATALEVSLTDLYNPMIIPQICGLVAGLAITVWFGVREKQRLGIALEHVDITPAPLTEEEAALRRPKLFWFNLLLIIVTIVCLVIAVLPPAGCFMAATVIALLVNYPNTKLQSKLIDSHAEAAMMMASTLFAAGVFTGIMSGSGMLTAMADGLVNILPSFIASRLALLLGIFSMPLSLLFDPDSFYYAVLPVLAQAGEAVGIPALAMARAAICGQITVGFPISPLTPSTFLLIGLSGVDLGDHQKHSFIPLWIVSLVIVFMAVIMGQIPV